MKRPFYRWTPVERMAAKRFLIQTLTILVWLTVILTTTQVLNEFHKLVQSEHFLPKLTLLFVYVTPSIVIVTLPFAILFAAYNVMNQMITDKEVVILHSFGTSFQQVTFPILALSALLSIVILALSLFVEPLTNRQSRSLLIDLQVENIQQLAESSTFHRLSKDLHLWYKSREADEGMRHLFISDARRDEEYRIYSAKRGYVRESTTEVGGTEMVFLDGTFQFQNTETGQVSTLTFDRHVEPLGNLMARGGGGGFSARQKETADLAETLTKPGISRGRWRRDLAELMRRTSDWVYAMAFAGLAVLAAGGANRHQSRSGWVMLGVLMLAVSMRITGMLTLRGAGGGLIPILSGFLLPFMSLAAIALLFRRTDGLMPRSPRSHPLLSAFSGAATTLAGFISSVWRKLAGFWSHSTSALPKLPSLPLPPRATLAGYVGALTLMRMMQLLFGIVAMLMLGQLLGMMSLLSGGDGPGLSLLLWVTALKVPALLPHVLPYVVLLATGFVIYGLTRHSEHVVMRAAGVSIWRFVLPFILCAFALGVATLVVLHPIISYADNRALSLSQELAGKPAQPLLRAQEPTWLTEADDTGWTFIRAANWMNPAQNLPGPIFVRFDHQHNLIERVESPSARLADGSWQMGAAKRIRPGSQEEEVASYEIPSRLTPELIDIIAFQPENKTVFSLMDRIPALRVGGADVTPLLARLHQHLSFPFLLAATALAAVAATVQRARTFGWGRLAIASVAIAFALYVLRTVFANFGESGMISPVMAAWSLPLLIGMTAATVLLYGEDG